MRYRGYTWPQFGDYVRVTEGEHLGIVEDIVGEGLSERFVLRILMPGSRDRIDRYALREIRRAEPPPWHHG